MKPGSDKNQLFSDTVDEGNCPHCDSEGSLVYGVKELDLDEVGIDSALVEGLICSNCREIYLSLDETARFLNLKAKHDKLDVYFGVHDGDIKESRLQ